MLTDYLVIIIALFIVFIAGLLKYPLFFLNRVLPKHQYTKSKDIAYGRDTRQCFDWYTPSEQSYDGEHPSNDEPELPQYLNHPVIVFVHGGAWDQGNKSDYEFVGHAFTQMGYAVCIPNYRLYPQAHFPHFIQDVASAVAELEDRLVSQFGIKTRIILVGHSAGAHTAAMLAADSRYFKESHTHAEIVSWIGLAGPYDLPLDDPLVAGKFDHAHPIDADQHSDHHHSANPINLAQSNMPPALLIHGDKDTTVGPYHTDRFARKLTALNVSVQTHQYSSVNHRQLIGGMAWMVRFLNPVFKDIEHFLIQFRKP